MEKIYMNENKSQKKSNIDFSVILSFAVAIFAVFSLVACGFSGISYAAPVTGEKLTFYKGMNDSGEQLFVSGETADKKSFRVPLYYSDPEFKNAIFCIEHANQNVATGTEYTKGEAITDYGLLYLLNNSFVNDVTIVPNGNRFVEAWVTQVAIWIYLADTDSANPKNALTQADRDIIKNVTKITVNDGVLGTNDKEVGAGFYDKYVGKLVEEAKKASNLKKISVSKADETLSKTSDGKYYQTSVITVVGEPSSDLINYDINITGIDGCIVVDENGKTLEPTGVAPGTKFYVRVPVDKVTEKTQTLNIGVNGNFKSLAGNEYNAVGDFQKIVSVTGSTTTVSNGTSMEIIGAPDTGMTTAQTIYFIGLVVLLCGVGIVYANAKPVNAKQ